VIVVGTGHRPDKIGSHKGQICEEIARRLDKLQPRLVISGMAQGFDQWLCEAALNHGIRVLAAVPFPAQPDPWPLSAQNEYRGLLRRVMAQGGEIVHVSRIDPVSREEASRLLRGRNNWMVMKALSAPPAEEKVLLACFNGDLSGSTINCIRYAHGKGLPVQPFDPYTLRSRHPRTLEMI